MQLTIWVGLTNGQLTKWLAKKLSKSVQGKTRCHLSKSEVSWRGRSPDDPTAEAWIDLQVAAKLTLNGSALLIAMES